ncbi:MAG: hypothetical protein ACLQVI_05975 [Polyangiaceae bacterium]
MRKVPGAIAWVCVSTSALVAAVAASACSAILGGVPGGTLLSSDASDDTGSVVGTNDSSSGSQDVTSPPQDGTAGDTAATDTGTIPDDTGPACASSGTCTLGDPCTSSTQCASNFCADGGTCAPEPCYLTGTCALGTACSSGTACASGTCLDSVCCSSAACPACMNCGATGQCTVAVKNAPDPSPTTCTGSDICNASGACVPLWTVLGSTVVDGAYYTNFVTVAENVIYISNPSNGSVTQYMVGFSLATNTWSTLTPSTDVAAAGFEGTFVGTSVGFAYVGNDADLYNGSAWVSLPYPSADQRGESAAAALGTVLYRVGGRLSSNVSQNSTLSYDLSQGAGGSWTTWADAPSVFEEACGGANPATNTIYVFGGDQKVTYAFNATANTWTTLPSASNYPGNCYLQTSATWNGALYVAESSSISQFTFATNTWSTGPTPPSTAGDGTMVTLGANGNLYLVGFASATNTITIYQWYGG